MAAATACPLAFSELSSRPVRFGTLPNIDRPNQAGIDLTLEGRGIEGKDIEVGALGPLHIGECLVDRAEIGDLAFDAILFFERFHPIGLGVAFPDEYP